MLEKVLYTTYATVKGGRGGHVQSKDGALNLDLVAPKEMGGDGRIGANPETLFAAGYAACFESASRKVALESGYKPQEGSYVDSEVSIGPRKEGGFELAVVLNIHLEGLTKEEAKKVAEKAHNEICPYSNATRGNIDVKVNVI